MGLSHTMCNKSKRAHFLLRTHIPGEHSTKSTILPCVNMRSSLHALASSSLLSLPELPSNTRRSLMRLLATESELDTKPFVTCLNSASLDAAWSFGKLIKSFESPAAATAIEAVSARGVDAVREYLQASGMLEGLPQVPCIISSTKYSPPCWSFGKMPRKSASISSLSLMSLAITAWRFECLPNANFLMLASGLTFSSNMFHRCAPWESCPM
mmetsp:Transcript_91821/g.145208  ORF Transcript_91821/g.145208 Transcript_91821/m.145208 type:complete len:212 (-) Transcript_91821:1100-1735(-)